ncbi:myosin-1 [Clonorchis sinensis]|uniref:Myosin-1 n=1 Tax=Clonorchis sinensis TaxID=79923 RepID=G7YAU8_CLOSI|nr:myosin-1 [Clonorchis sinensis]
MATIGGRPTIFMRIDPQFTGKVDRLSMELNKRDKLIQQLSKHLYQLWRANDSLFADYESQETHLTSQLRGLRSRLRDATQTLRQRHSLPRSPSAPPLRTSPIREAVLKFAQDLQTKMAQVDNTILVAEYTELRAAVLDLIVSWDSIDSTEQGRKCERLFLSALHFVELGLAEPARSKPSALTELEARVRQADQQVMYYSTVVEQLRRELQLAKQLSPQMEVTPFVPHESVRVDLSVYEDLDPVSSSTALRAFASCDPPSTPYAEHSSDVSDISSPAVSPTCLDGRSECSVSIVQPITPLEDGVKLDDYQGLTQQEVLVEEFSYGTTAGDKQSSSIDLRQQLGNLLALKESELWRTTANEQIELEIRALRTACSVLSKVHTTRSVGTNLYQLRDAGVQTQDVELQYRTIISSNIIESLEPGDTHLEQVKTDERFDTVVYRPTPDSVERRTDVYRLLEERLIQIVTRLRDLLVAADSTIIHQMGIESVISQWESFVENLHICLRNPGARGLQPLPTSPCITVVDHASAKSINNEEVAQTDGHSVVGSTGVTDAVRKQVLIQLVLRKQEKALEMDFHLWMHPRKSVSQPAYLYHVETVQHIRENIWQLRAIHGELTGRVNYCMSWMRDHLNFLTSEIGSLAKKLSNTKHKNLRDAAIGTDQPLAPPVIVEASRFPFLDVSSAGRFSSGDRIPVCGDNISDENACAHRATYRDLQFPCERLSTDSVELTSGLHAELLHLRSTQGSLQAQLNAANDEINALTSYLMRIKVELMESLPKNESSAFGTLLDNLEFQAVPQLVSWYIRWATESLGAYSTQLEHRTTSCVHLQNQLDATQYRLNTMEQNYHCVVSEHTETLKQVDDLRRHFQWESDKRSGFQSGMSDRETDRKLFPSHSVASIFDSGLNEVSPIYPGERATLTTPSRSNFNEAIAPEVTLETEPMLQSAQSRVLCSDGGRYVQPVLSHNSPYHPCQIGHCPIFNDDKSLLPELNAGTMNPECDSPHVSDIGSSDESGQLDVQRLMLKLIHNEQCLAENRQELQLVAAAKVELEAQVNKLIGDSHTLQTVKKQLQYSEQQKSDLEYRLQNLQELFSEKSSREAGLSDDLQKARNVIESMSGRISDLSVAKEELEATLIQVVTERDQTKNELKQTRSQLNSALAERDVTWQRLNSVTGELHQQEDLRANLESELVLNREQLLQKENEIALLRIEFASLQTKYQQAQHELEHQTVVLSTHVQTLEVRNTNIDKQVGTDELPTNSWTDLQASEFEYMRQRIKYLEQTNEQMSRELKDGLDKLSLRLEMSDSRDEKLSDIKKLVLCEKEAAFEHRSYIHLETAHVIDCEAEYMKQQLELPGVEDAHISTAACEDISASHAAKRQEYLPPIMDGQSMLSHGQSDHAIITKAEVRRTQSEPTDIKTHLDTKKTRREHANSKWTPVDVHQVCNAWNGYPASVTHDTEAPIDKNSRSLACVTKWMEISTQQQTYSAEADTDVDSLDLAKPTMTSTSADLLPLQISSTVNAISQPIMTSHVIRASPTEYELSPSSLLRTQAELSVELRSRGEQIDVLTRLVRDREAALCDVRYVVSSMEAECSRLGDRVFELSSELDRVNGVNRVLSAKCLEFGIECDGVESRLDVCGFDSDSQIVGVSSGDVQVPLSVSERSIVSSVSSGVQTDPDAVLCRLQQRVVDVDMVGERAAPVVDRVSAGVFDVVDSDVMDAVVSKGIFVESSDLENRLADALCRIDVLEKEKCQLESQLSSVCASSMVDVMNSHVCGLPSVVRSVVTEPLLACSDVVCGDVKKVPESELSDLLSRLSSAEGEVSLLRDCLSKRVDLLDRMRVDLCGAVNDLGGMWNDISVLCSMRDAKSEVCLSESVDFGCDSAAVSLPPVSRHMVSRSTSTTFEFSDSLFLSSIRSLSQCVRLCYVVSRCLETDVSPDLLSISTHLREPAIEDWSLSENFGGARILEFLWELCSQLHSCLSRLSDLCPTRVSSLMSEIGNLKRHNMSVTDENESLKRTIQAMCKPPTRHPILNRFSSEVTKSMSEVTTNFAPSHGSQYGVSIFGLTSSNLPDTASASDPSNWLPMDPVKQEQGELPGEMTDVPLDSQIDRAPVPPKHMLKLTLSNEEVTGLTPSVEAALKEEIQKCEELQHQYNQLKQQFSELCEERMQLSNWNLCLRDSLKASELELLALRGQQGIQLTMETGTEPLIPWDRIVADILANCATSVTSVECGCQTDATASTPHTSSEVRSELLYSGDITLCTGYPPLPPKHLKQLTSDMGIPRNASDLQETIKSSDQIASVDLKTPEYDPQTSRSSELLLPSVCIFKQLQSGLGNELLMPPPRAPRRMHAYHATHEHIVTHDLKSEPIDIRNSTDETMVRSDLRRKTTFQNQNQESERPDTVISQVVHPVMSTSASLRVCESEASALPSLSATPGFSRVLVDSVCQSVSIGPTSPSVPADVGLAVSDGWIEYAGASMCDVGVGSSEMFGRGDVSGVVSVHLIGDSVSNADVGAPERVDVGVGPLEPSELSLSSDRMELLPPPPPCPVCLTPSFDVPPEVVHGAVAEVDGSDSSLLRTQAELSVELRSRGEQIDVLTRLVRDREAALCDVRYVVSSMEAECSRLGDRVFELSSELDRVNGVNRVLSAKCLEFGIECDGVESRLDVCGFDSDSQIVGVSSGDVQVPLSVSERSIVSSVSSGVQTDPDAVLCRLQRELASVRGEHLQLLSLCDRARSELAAKQFAADCLGVTSVVSVDVGQQTEACLLESVSSVGLGVDPDISAFQPEEGFADVSSCFIRGVLWDHVRRSASDVLSCSLSGDGRSFVAERGPGFHVEHRFPDGVSHPSGIPDSVCDCFAEVDRLRVMLQRTNLDLVCAVDELDVHKVLVPGIINFILWCRSSVLDLLRTSSAFFELERPLVRVADLHPDCFRGVEVQDLFVFPDPEVPLSVSPSGLVECSNLSSCDVDGVVSSNNDNVFGYTASGVPVVSTGDSSALGHLVVPPVNLLYMDSANFLPQEQDSLDLCKLLSVTHKRVNELEASLRSSEEDKDQLQLTIADLEKQMREKDVELADALDELRAHRAELETSLNLFLEKSDEFDSLRAENLSLQNMANDAVQRQRAAIVDAESTHECLMKTELEVVSLKDRLVTLDREVSSLKDIISHRDQELTDASTLREELEVTISRLQSEGRKKDATIAGLHFELTTASEKSDAVNADLCCKQMLCTRFENRLAGVVRELQMICQYLVESQKSESINPSLCSSLRAHLESIISGCLSSVDPSPTYHISPCYEETDTSFASIIHDDAKSQPTSEHSIPCLQQELDELGFQFDPLTMVTQQAILKPMAAVDPGCVASPLSAFRNIFDETGENLMRSEPELTNPKELLDIILTRVNRICQKAFERPLASICNLEQRLSQIERQAATYVDKLNLKKPTETSEHTSYRQNSSQKNRSSSPVSADEPGSKIEGLIFALNMSAILEPGVETTQRNTTLRSVLEDIKELSHRCLTAESERNRLTALLYTMRQVYGEISGRENLEDTDYVSKRDHETHHSNYVAGCLSEDTGMKHGYLSYESLNVASEPSSKFSRRQLHKGVRVNTMAFGKSTITKPFFEEQCEYPVGDHTHPGVNHDANSSEEPPHITDPRAYVCEQTPPCSAQEQCSVELQNSQSIWTRNTSVQVPGDKTRSTAKQQSHENNQTKPLNLTDTYSITTNQFLDHEPRLSSTSTRTGNDSQDYIPRSHTHASTSTNFTFITPMIRVMNSHVCGLPSVVRSVVTEPLLACSDVVCGDVKKVPESELSDLLSRLSSAEGEVSLLRDCLSKRVDLLDRMRVDLCGAVSDLRDLLDEVLSLRSSCAVASVDCVSLEADLGAALSQVDRVELCEMTVAADLVASAECALRNTNIDKQVGTDELPTNSWTDLQASEFEYMRQRIKYLEQTNEQMSRELKDGLDKLSLRLEMSDSRDEKLSDIKKLVLCEKEAAFEHRSYIHLETAHVIDCEAEYMKQQLELPGVEDAHISTAACEDISASHAAKRQEYLPPIMDGQSMLSHGQSDHAIITKAEVRRTQSEPTDIKTHLDTKKTRREHANSKWTPVDVHQVCNAWNGYPASVTHDTEAPIDKNSRSLACVTKWMEISTQQQTYSAEADTDVDSLDLAKPTMTSTSADLLPLQISSTVNAISQPIMTSHVIRASPTEYELSPSSLLRTQAELSVELRSRGEQIDVLTRLVRDREAALCDVRYVVSSMEAECSRLGDRVFELSSELDRVNGVNRVLSAKCLEFGIECDGVESRLDVCGFDSDSQIVGVSSGDVQVPLSVSERSIVSSVSSGVQTDPDAVLCRLQRELASVRGEHLQLLSLCDRARSELAAKQFAADCLGVTSVVSVDVGQQTEACLLESVSSVGLGVDQDVFDTVPCDSLAASGAPVLDAIVSVDHSSSFDVIPSGISMCDVDQSVVGVDVVLGDGRSCVSERVVDVDMVGERAAPVVDRVSAGVFDVVDSDVMDAVVSKGIFVESSDLENRLADALCRIDVLEKEKCQLESQLSSVCASSMVDVMNSHVCGLPSVVRSVVAEPLLVASAGAVAVDVDVELLRLRSLHLEWSRVARSVVGVCDTFLGCESRDCAVSDLCPEVLESRCSAVFDLFRTRSEIQCQVENECNLLRERLAASSDFYGAAARELCNIRSVVDGLVVEFELFKSRFSRLLVSINELDELDVGQLRENLLDSLLLNSQDVPRVNDFVPEILPFSCPAETPQFLADGAEGPPGLIPDLKGIDSLFTIHEEHTICERVAMLGKEDVESSVYRSPNDPSKYLSSARLTSTIPAAESKECSTQAGVKLAVFDRNLWDFKENFAVMKRFVRASLSFSRWACSTLANEIKCHINLSPDHYRSFACELQELLDHLHQLQSTSTLDLTPLDEIEYSGALNLAVENSDKICSHAGSTSWETNLNEPTRKVSTEAATTTGINNDDSSMVADKRLASTKTDVLSTFVYALCLLVNKDQCCRIRHLLTEENPSDEFVDVLNGLLHRVELQLTAMSPSHRNSAEDSFPSAEATTSRRPDFSVEKSSCLQKFLNQLNVFLNNPRFSVCDVTAGEFRSYLDNILMKLNLEAPVTVSRTNSDHLIESGEFAVEKSGNIPLSVTDSSMDPIQSLEKEFQTILQSVIRCLSELPRCIENMQVQMGYEYSRPQSCGHTDLVTSLSDNLSRIPEVTELLLIVSVLQEALVQFEGHINEYRQRMRSDLISAQEDMKVLEIETVLERLGQEEVSSRLSEMLSHLLHPSTSAATSASAASPPLELKVVDEQLTRAPSIDSTTAPTHIKVKSACLPSESVNSPASNEAYEKEGNQPLLSGPRETICGSTSEETKDQLVENIHPLISATMNVDASTPTPYDPLEIKHVTSAQRLHRSHSVPVLRDVCFGCVEHSMPEKVYGSTSDVKDCENVYADQSARRLHLLRFLNILEAYFPAFLLHSSNYLHSVLGCFLRPSTIRSGLRFLRHLLLVIPDALLHSEPSELAVQLESQLQRTELHLRRRMTRLRGQLVSIPRQSPDLDARSFRPDLDQINRELEEVTRGYKCVHDLLPVCLPLHPDGPSCSSLLRLASLGTDVYPAFESILPPHIPLLTNESSVLYNNLLKRLLHLRDTEVLYLLMLIGHPLPSTESSVKQKLKKFANWNLVTPIDLHTMPVYRVPVDTIGAYLNTPGAISTTSIITAKPETDHYSTICLPSAVSGPDENNESSNAIVARSSTQLIHCLIQQSREIVENLRTRPDQPCPSSSSVVEGNLYRFEQRLSELIENLQTECLSLRISAQSPGAAHPESAVPSISESSGYPKRAARPPISDLIGAVDQMDELMELRNLAKHLFDQYNIVSSELEHNLDINWCLRQRLNAANEQIDQISKQLYRGHHSLACMEERLSLETEKHAMLTEQCDITRQQTRKTAHILEGLLEKHEHVPSTSADVRFDSVPSLGHSVTAMPRPALKLTHSTEEIRKRQGLLPVMYTRQITHPRLASTPLKHSVSSQTTKQSKFSCLSLNCAPMRRKSPSDLTPTREHERLPSHRRRTIADTKSSTTVARRQTDTSTTFPLSSTSRDDSRFSLQSNNNAVNLSDPSAKPFVTTSHPATMAFDWHKDASYPAEHILTSSDWSDIGTLETALTQSSTVSIPSTSVHTHLESRLSTMPKKPKKRKHLLGRLFTRKRHKKI